MSIQLPQLFDEKLQGHAKEMGIVHSAVASFGSWFESSGTPVFFRDYTDHGPKHLSNVLATAAAMIPKEAAQVFSAADVTIFVLATLLHDSALHLAEPGFHQLIKGDAKDRRVEGFDTSAWPTLWDEFLFTARRWDNEKLAALFGDEFVEQGHSVSDPFERWGNLTAADYKLIGEFIRRHHPRLAHEFALFGVPGNQVQFLTLPPALSPEWRDLAGVTARSHGLPLRGCLDHIGKKYHKRDYQSIHAVYLMALLRLSDYLQIEAARAPQAVFGYRVLPSRTSQLEWRAHQAVKNITPESEDPESVEIRAEPPDVETFLRLREWLDGIQSELDTSWAVLGEVYGRFPSRVLGLHWRRVRSNLDDVATFATSVSYLPRRIRVEVARAELLSLLIRPLYGDDPSYGVRELMQNAVDAVREREYFQLKHPEHAKPPLRKQEADVVIWLSEFDEQAKCAWVEISDRGIGMTEQVITDYFLKAGASYRHSDHWRRIFERSGLPPDPTKPLAQITRAGRFGVGALAGFLLGNELEVETRNIASPVGFRFKVGITQEAIQIERVAELPVGTRVRVRVSAKTLEVLWKENSVVSKPGLLDWYLLKRPTVVRLRGASRRLVEDRIYRIDLDDWQIAETSKPLKIHWQYPRNNRAETIPSLSCNGIFVSNSAKLPEIRFDRQKKHLVPVAMPLVHVTDNDGYFRLNIARNGIVGDEYGFETELYEAIIKDHLAKILCCFPEHLSGTDVQRMFAESYHIKSNSGIRSLLFSATSYCHPFSSALRALGNPIHRVLWVKEPDDLPTAAQLSAWDCVIVQNGEGLSKLTAHPSSYPDGLGFFKELGADGAYSSAEFRTTLPAFHSDDFPPEELAERLKGRSLFTRAVQIGRGSEKTEWQWLMESEGMPTSAYDFLALTRSLTPVNQYHVPHVAEFVLPKPWQERLAESFLDEWWPRYFGSEWIPWKKADRRAKFPKAYAELAPYIARYEK